jgi:hypothetical protein
VSSDRICSNLKLVDFMVSFISFFLMANRSHFLHSFTMRARDKNSDKFKEFDKAKELTCFIFGIWVFYIDNFVL